MTTLALNRHKLINITLLALLFIIGGAYAWLYANSDENTATTSQVSAPASTASASTVETKSERKLVPITPEEKDVVAQNEHLEPIVEKAKQYLSEFDQQEASLHQQDIQAKQIIEKLEHQVNAAKAKGTAQ